MTKTIKKPQKQVQDGGHATLSVKVSQETYNLLNILAEGLQHGTNANDLLKMFVHAFIESAKHDGPVSPDMQVLLNLLKIDEGWHKAFNFADVNCQKRIAQVILVLEEPGRKGFGLTMINRPYMGESFQTYCVDDILERVVEVSMKGLYKELREIGVHYGTESMRETLTLLCDARKIEQLNESFSQEMPQMGVHSDFGRAIEYANKYQRHKHRTPDSLANSKQQRIIFEDDDRQQADNEVDYSTNHESNE